MCYNTPAQKNMKRRIPMKTAKRTLSILLALLMLASCLAIGTSADGSNVLTQPEWNSYWETVRNDNTLIALTPGADATQLNFCWHSDDTAKSGVVRIGKSADKSGKPDVGHHEKKPQQRRHPRCGIHLRQQSNGNDQKCIVGQ